MAALPFSSADPLSLFRYFPQFIRSSDDYYSNSAAGEGILARLTYMLEKEAGAHVEAIRELATTIDVDNCPVIYVDYLASLLGEEIPGDWREADRRMFLRQLANIIKLKGLHLGFVRRAAFANRKRTSLVELAKTELYEQHDYSRTLSVAYPYRAARVDIAECQQSCEVYCELLCEYGGGVQAGEILAYSAAKSLLDGLGQVLPIHVLLRLEANAYDIRSAWGPSPDTLGCETDCQAYAESWTGSEVHGSPVDEFPLTQEHVQVTLQCLLACEASCQSCCECGMEDLDCLHLCETTCQVACEEWCQLACQVADCQTDCQLGNCQTGCEAFAQTCASYCQVALEVSP